MAERTITIAVDAMGGYHAPVDIVAAVAHASRVGDESVYFILVGDEVRISEALYQAGHNPERISVVHAGSVVNLNEPAAV